MTSLPTTRLAAIAIALAAAAQAAQPAPAIRASHDRTSGRVSITEAGKPVLEYPYRTVPVPQGYFDGLDGQRESYARKYAIPRSNYIHPLCGPDGTPLTSDWNEDHAHHRGVYWAWPELRFGDQTGDLHALQRVFARPTGKIEIRHGADWAELEAENRWLWEDKTPIVRETATIRAWQASASGRHVDLTLKFEALVDGVSLARRGTDAYGGLNIRLAKIGGMKLAHHADPPTADPRVAWQLASGTWSGATAPASMIVFEHASNPGYPGDYVEYPDLPWFQPTFPRAGTRHALGMSKPLTLRYRIWIRPGPTPDADELRAGWSGYQSSAAEDQQQPASPAEP